MKSEQQVADARAVLQEWVDQQGHNRCWYYPDLFRRLCTILDVQPTVPPCLPPLSEFKEGCARYQGEEYQLVEIVRWPDGFWVLKEEFDYERDYSHRSDDFETVQITQEEYEKLL